MNAEQTTESAIPQPRPFDYPDSAAWWCSRWAKGPCSVRVWSYGFGDSTRLVWPFDWDREGWEDEHFGWEERYMATKSTRVRRILRRLRYAWERWRHRRHVPGREWRTCWYCGNDREAMGE